MTTRTSSLLMHSEGIFSSKLSTPPQFNPTCGISASGGKTWKNYIPGKIAFDSEVATLAGKTGIAFATIDDARMMTDTPFDVINRMNIDNNGNLHRQVKTMASILIQALRDPLMPTSA